MNFFKLENKINELKHFAEHGLSDVKQTGLASLNGFVGLKKGYPVFIAGSPHAGKTEFTFEMLMNTSILYGWKHFIYCGEGGNIEHIYAELLHKYLEKPYKYADEKDKLKAEYFVSEHFIIANHDNDYTISEFYDVVDKCEKELNIKFDTTLFDPFNDIKDESDMFGGRDDKYLAYALKIVRVSSKKNNRIDILVNHIADIRPVVDSSGNRYLPPALPNEWAGGRTWWRRGFLMLLVYRPPVFLKDAQGMPYEENETHIHIQKAKPKGIAKMGVRSIFWDWKKNRYYCFEDNQKLYSCEKIEDFKSLKPNVDFTQSAKEKEELF
jgi:hypothetical protein